MCLKFDGKSSAKAIGHNLTERVHHLTVIKEGFEQPDPKYVDHMECGETGIDMAKAVLSVVESTESQESLLAIGSDGTNSNTGHHTGALRYCNSGIQCSLFCNNILHF